MRKTRRETNQQEPGLRAVGGEAEAVAEQDQKPEINWSHWWPFDRATGVALRQLNQKQVEQYEDALL